MDLPQSGYVPINDF